VLSVFSGLGGLDLGLECAGFDVVGCIENDDVAQRSLKQNRPAWRILEPSDVTVLADDLAPRDVGLEPGELTVLAGAPPCQPYSKAAMWSAGSWNGLADNRATPIFAFLSLVDTFLPRSVVIENVPGFVRGRNSALAAIDAAFDQINKRHGTQYIARVSVLDAADHGVPQHRERAILIAVRDGTDVAWPSAAFVDDPVRSWDALHDVELRGPLPVAIGQWAELLPTIPEGGNYLWHTDRGGGEPIFGYRTRYWSFLLKLAKRRPSWTLPAQPGPSVGPFHWDNRPLAVEEMLRLQSFPAAWQVEGTRRDQVRQVGNATPPLLAELVGRAVLTTLGDHSPASEPVLAIRRLEKVPSARRPRGLPDRFAHLVGEHEAHPGTGLGPSPRPPS
jgi:DNA (cytosine-5)-methyltransferase 1